MSAPQLQIHISVRTSIDRASNDKASSQNTARVASKQRLTIQKIAQESYTQVLAMPCVQATCDLPASTKGDTGPEPGKLQEVRRRLVQDSALFKQAVGQMLTGIEAQNLTEIHEQSAQIKDAQDRLKFRICVSFLVAALVLAAALTGMIWVVPGAMLLFGCCALSISLVGVSLGYNQRVVHGICRWLVDQKTDGKYAFVQFYLDVLLATKACAEQNAADGLTILAKQAELLIALVDPTKTLTIGPDMQIQVEQPPKTPPVSDPAADASAH